MNMASRADSSVSKPAKETSTVLGRSAATGMFVLKPYPGKGTVSRRAVQSAIKTVLAKKK